MLQSENLQYFTKLYYQMCKVSFINQLGYVKLLTSECVALNEGDFLDDLQTLWRSKVWVGGESRSAKVMLFFSTPPQSRELSQPRTCCTQTISLL